jgi:transposase
MGREKSLTIDTKERIIKLKEDGLKQKEIAEILNISPTSVCSVIKKYKKEKILESHKPGAGRKCKTTKRDERTIKRVIEKNRFTTVTDLKNTLQESGIDVSRATTHRRMKDLKYSSYKSRCKPLLNIKQRRKRIDWSRIHKNKDPHFWKNVIFSDESYFEIPIGQKGRVWRKKMRNSTRNAQAKV